MFYQDIYKHIFKNSEVTDWPAICLTSKNFNQIMQDIKKEYFRKLVIHDIFLPKEFKFQLVNNYLNDYKFLQPILNHDVKIIRNCYRQSKNDKFIISKFKFTFDEFKFIYTRSEIRGYPLLHDNHPLVHETPTGYCVGDELSKIIAFKR
jgi:hypothetical protein